MSFASATPVASTLFVVIVVASLLGLYALPALIERNLFRPYWFIREREFATPVSSAFIHADLPHLIFNGFTFWAFAFPLERSIGSPRFAALYAFGLFVSNFGTWLRQRENPGYRCLGASGAISAVLFAAIVYVPSASIMVFPIPLPVPAPLFALLYLGYSAWAAKRATGGINHDAHLSGALAGLLFVALTEPSAIVRALRYVTG